MENQNNYMGPDIRLDHPVPFTLEPKPIKEIVDWTQSHRPYLSEIFMNMELDRGISEFNENAR